MSEAAADNVKAITVLPTCSDALYLKGYASLDLGRVEIAEQYIKRALAMAPVNAMYLSELGHLQHSKRDWLGAIEIFTQAESAAKKFSPPEIKDQELTRAKRGIGYSLTELGKLDEAEEKFKECLDINPQDSVALREIDYIKNLRTQGLGEADTSKDIDH